MTAAAVPDPRRCGNHCPHLTASTSDRCGLPRGHDGPDAAHWSADAEASR